MANAFETGSCTECNTSFDRLAVERDEDSGAGYLVLPVTPCADDNCGKFLCACCPQFHCDGCGHTFCADHMISVPDGTDRPLHICEPCEAVMREYDAAPLIAPHALPAPMPVRPELRPAAIAWEVA